MRLASFALAVALASAGVARPRLLSDSPIRPFPTFVEETASAGIDSIYTGEWEYMVGGGAATFDCNGDGYPDMLLAGGETAGEVLSQCQRAGGGAEVHAPSRAASNWTR